MPHPSSPYRRLRHQVYLLLESHRGFAPRLINLLLMLLIFFNVVAEVAESVADIARQYGELFHQFELISVAIFTVEYLLRLWVAPENPDYGDSRWPRLAFARSGMAIIDVLAIAPFYFGMFVDIDARVLRGLRLFRVFKLTRYSSSMDLLFTVVKKELPSIGSALFVMSILIILAASGIYAVERDVQPDKFGSIPSALWWATVTLTTVGYGDVVPLTAGGRVFGMLLMLTGVGMAALPAGILAAGYSRELQLRRETYEEELKDAMSDGELDLTETAELEVLRGQLGLTEQEARKVLSTLHQPTQRCPHCGHQL